MNLIKTIFTTSFILALLALGSFLPAATVHAADAPPLPPGCSWRDQDQQSAGYDCPSPRVTCSVSPTTQTSGQASTWSSVPSRGDGTYTYSWRFSDGTTATTQNVTKIYNGTGSLTGQVRVTSYGANSGYVACTNSVTYTAGATPPVTPPIVPQYKYKWWVQEVGSINIQGSSFIPGSDTLPFSYSMEAISFATLVSGRQYDWWVEKFNLADSSPTGQVARKWRFTFDGSAPQISFNNIASDVCYDTSGDNIWPGKISLTATDSEGVANVQLKIRRDPSSWYSGSSFGASETTLTATQIPSSTTWEYSLPTSALTSGSTYSLWAQATDINGNVRAFPDPGPDKNFAYNAACTQPWLQTTGGDVHSNTKIDTPGGP